MVKGLFKNSSAFVQILLLFLFVILGVLFGESLHRGFLFLQNGFSMEGVNESMLNMQGNAQLLRQSFFFQALCGFFLPALILSWLFSDDVRHYLHTEQGFSGSVMMLTVLGIIFLIPFQNAVIYWTQQIPLPESLKAVEVKITQWEEQAQQMVGLVLTTDKYLTFLTNLLIVAVFTAVGEEFLFRGVLLNIFKKVFKNPHVAIWTVGIIFSFVHFQFYGFFARAILGAYLGYLLYYSKSIWIPVLAHFTQNAIGVIGFYSVKDPEMLKKIDLVGVGSTSWVAVLSLALFTITFTLLIKKCKSQDFPS
ncbi:MAG: CPBP family intramembrane metalloprotease [Dysgonamonadaceae bacterium]|nr:CPBP family intramembrane metalloprotease [Dysgonamonadaceae bacterium]